MREGVVYPIGGSNGLQVVVDEDEDGRPQHNYTSYGTLLLRLVFTTSGYEGPADELVYVTRVNYKRYSAATTKHQKLLAALYPTMYRYYEFQQREGVEYA